MRGPLAAPSTHSSGCTSLRPLFTALARMAREGHLAEEFLRETLSGVHTHHGNHRAGGPVSAVAPRAGEARPVRRVPRSIRGSEARAGRLRAYTQSNA